MRLLYWILFWVLLCTFSRWIEAQQAPIYDTPIMDFNNGTSHRQSVCHLQRQLNNGTLELRNALAGLDLHIVLFAGDVTNFLLPPFSKTIPAENPGIAVEILDNLAERAGFQWRKSFGLADLKESASELQNTTFNEILYWSTEMYDVSATMWSQSLERINQGVSYPQGWFDASIILIGEKPGSEKQLNVWSFLEPFSMEVWILIGLTVLVSAVIYWWMECYDENSDSQELQTKPTENLFLAALSFTGDNRYEPTTDFARLFVFSMAFFFLLIGSAYTANLASFLVVQNRPTIQVESVEDAVRQGKSLCLVSGGSVLEQLVKQKHPGARFVYFESEDLVTQGIRNGDCDFALTTVGDWSRVERNAEINGDCQLTWIGRVFRFLNAGFTTRSDSGILCTSLIRDVLNLHLLEMIEENELDELWQRELERQTSVRCDAVVGASADDNDSSQLGIQDTGGIFIVHYSMVFLAILMALVTKRKNPFAWRPRFLRRRENTADEQASLDGLDDPAQNEGAAQVQESAINFNTSPLEDLYAEQEQKLATLTRQMSEMLQELNTVSKESKQMGELIRDRDGTGTAAHTM